MLTNSHEFREVAKYFEDNDKYPCGIYDTPSYWKFWKREEGRCLNGYVNSDGIRVSGYHYFYLNYCPIIKVESKTETTGDRIEGFPDFWDVDWIYFTSLEIAENGITIEEYKKLPLELNIDIEDEDNLKGGKHLGWLKARGVGASWKGGAVGLRNYFLIRNSKSFYIAAETEFLNKDGIFSKFLLGRDFINEHTGFFKFHDVKNDLNKMHVKASHRDSLNKEVGYMSEVIGVTLHESYQKARGKRGKAVLWEEAGKFPNLDKAWQIARKSVEQGKVTFGTMIFFGTGGTEGADFEPMKRLFYNPKANNCLVFNNVWDEDRYGTKCCLFTPAYQNVEYKDKDGNSDTVKTRKIYDEKRKEAESSSDPTAIDQEKAESPYCPGEATLSVGKNIFPKAEMQKWRTELINTGKLLNMGLCGDLVQTPKGTKFLPSLESKPVLDYPIKKNANNKGCIIVYEPPIYFNGKIAPYMYYICVDPYAHNTSSGDSVGAIYVLKNINNISKPDDWIVASYIGRPDDIDNFNYQIELLAEYYQCKIGFENDRGERLLAYFKNRRKLYLLEEEFELGYNSNIAKSGVKREYGMHMSSGKDNKRKLDGDKYIQEWLMRERGIDDEGNRIFNYHKIYDIGLLEELINYNTEGNFDRVSALRIGVYMQKEIDYKFGQVRSEREKTDLYFDEILFSD